MFVTVILNLLGIDPVADNDVVTNWVELPENELLLNVEYISKGELKAPEAVEFDKDGNVSCFVHCTCLQFDSYRRIYLLALRTGIL